MNEPSVNPGRRLHRRLPLPVLAILLLLAPTSLAVNTAPALCATAGDTYPTWPLTCGGTGGDQNDANAQYSTVSGGFNNDILGGSDRAFLGGGADNLIGGGAASPHSAMAGGEANAIAGSGHALLGGGDANAVTDSPWATLGGGATNAVTDSEWATLGGGQDNTIDASPHAGILGGQGNLVQGSPLGTVTGGVGNVVQASPSSGVGTAMGSLVLASPESGIAFGTAHTITTSHAAVIAGGLSNHHETTDVSTISGGIMNVIGAAVAPTLAATIAGGFDNAIAPGSNGASIGGGYGTRADYPVQWAHGGGDMANLAATPGHAQHSFYLQSGETNGNQDILGAGTASVLTIPIPAAAAWDMEIRVVARDATGVEAANWVIPAAFADVGGVLTWFGAAPPCGGGCAPVTWNPAAAFAPCWLVTPVFVPGGMQVHVDSVCGGGDVLWLSMVDAVQMTYP